jgi:endonuclease-3
MRRLRVAVKPYPPAAMFQLADEGYRSLFEQLIACIVSIRTLDETTLPACRQLFAVARTPDRMANLSTSRIDQLIGACTFHQPKAKQIHQIAERSVKEFGGELPCDFETLTAFHGVGPKCANLALGIACDEPHGIPVDIHVHRVTNRWGYVAAAAPEATMVQLESKLPRRYWMEINKLLVPFGKFICAGARPKCSTCPLLEMCRQVGVTAHE